MNPSKGMEAAEAEIDRLRATLAALVAENEALKGRLKDSTNDGKFLEEKVVALKQEVEAMRADLVSTVAREVAYRERLAAFESWQPSDPGTKEAMKIAWRDETSTVLADALRAAMVRLEEAEKESKGLRERLAQNHDWYCPCGHWNGANLDQCAACARHPGEQR